MPDNTYALAKVYHGQGGDNLVVASGGTLTVESGAAFTVPGGYPLAASSANHRAVYGSVTVTGTATVNVGSALTGVLGCIATLGTAVSVTDPHAVSIVPSGTVVTISAWKADGSASAVASPVHYAIFGPAA